MYSCFLYILKSIIDKFSFQNLLTFKNLSSLNIKGRQLRKFRVSSSFVSRNRASEMYVQTNLGRINWLVHFLSFLSKQKVASKLQDSLIAYSNKCRFPWLNRKMGNLPSPLLCSISSSFLMLSSRACRVCFCVSIRVSSSCRKG